MTKETSRKAIVLIYKRTSVSPRNSKDENIKLHIYRNHDVTIGSEIKEFNSKVFIDENGIQYSYIEDIYSLDEEYVYAFPYYVTTSKDKQNDILNEIFDDVSSHDDYTLLQLYEETDAELTTFATSDKNNKKYAIIDPSSYDGYSKIRETEFRPLVKGKFNAETIEEKDEEPKNVNIIIPKTEPFEPLKTDEMFNHVTKSVICQDEQVRSIVTGFAKNQRITAAVEENPDKRNTLTEAKQNFFVCGPTGVGKTAILRSVAECANVPIIFEDATRYTMEGYVGESPENILKNLLRASDYNIPLAQRGIIVIDEIDKKASSPQISPAATTEVQSSFLTMMQGQKYPINISGTKNSSEIITFDTSTVTFAFLGAYSGIEQFYSKEKNMGFGADVLKKGVIDDYTQLYSPENLIKYGMIAEFLGRANIVSLRGLDDVDAMSRIILESNKSPSVINKELYSLIGINLILQDDAIKPLAEKAIGYKAGARGIKKAFDEILGASEYSIFSSNSPKEIIITPESVEDPKKLVLHY